MTTINGKPPHKWGSREIAMNMRITPYNLHETIEMLRARAFRLLMSETPAEFGLEAEALWNLVGDMTRQEAANAIKAWEDTQG